MSVRPPVLRTTGAAAAARPAALLAALDEPVLAHWLSTRRWFAAKGYGLVRVTLHDAVPVVRSTGGRTLTRRRPPRADSSGTRGTCGGRA